MQRIPRVGRKKRVQPWALCRSRFAAVSPRIPIHRSKMYKLQVWAESPDPHDLFEQSGFPANACLTAGLFSPYRVRLCAYSATRWEKE